MRTKMAPDLPEKLPGIDIDEADDDRRRESLDESEAALRVVRFEIGTHQLAVPVDVVRTIADVPSDFTRVPRAPKAIEGLTDLRGEVTAVIDLTAYFPSDDGHPDANQLLVFDPPADEQPAAIRVSEVLGIDTVSDDDITDAADTDVLEYSGDALEHPLVEALIERERQSIPQEGKRSPTEVTLEAADGTNRSERGSTALDRPTSSDAASDSELVESNGDKRISTGSGERSQRRVVVDVVPLVSVEDVLLASGHPISAD
ncbi:chemotaxis protein CheW [Natrarchaeobius halalkaliphilus]|uniref:Chemotaxis protein CheW n=1 Tax=Natrarchaeobius halalkaliphilus TaxID=1679091 RepID=A0A3N6M9R9_9EURY|nr:chemotaxis protein CheW [Natrarchaeobius halalkaliphilus]RQG90296.1 chemotaxis protein CheW [Natrarchaeobius halalkaliphilus]